MMKCIGVTRCPLSDFDATPDDCLKAEWLGNDLVRCGFGAEEEDVVNVDESGCFT